MGNFNEAIGQLRKKKGLKQAEIAELVGISPATWSDYERGKTEPNFEVLRRISEFFGVSVDLLLSDAGVTTHLIDAGEDSKNAIKITPKRTPTHTPNSKKSVFKDLPSVLISLREKAGLTIRDIQSRTGIKADLWQKWEESLMEPSVEDIFTIAQIFEVSIDDLLKGSLVQTTPNLVNESGVKYSRMPKVITVDGLGQDNVVLVPVRARAGYLSGYEDPDFIQTLPTYRLPGLNHGTFRMFEVFGHSMVPTFHESDIIICRFVDNLLEIRDDRINVVVSKREGVVVKRVVNRVQKDGVLILNSDNQRHTGEYPPIIINPEEILEIWYAVAFMSRQMRAPGEVYNRLIDVESRLTILEAETKKALPK
jgi:transcriptional regulator with XRE-family HTH domain